LLHALDHGVLLIDDALTFGLGPRLLCLAHAGIATRAGERSARGDLGFVDGQREPLFEIDG
jgi:hypothetical protein